MLPLSAVFVSLFLLFVPISDATQTPRMSLDWGIADDTYNEAANSMTIGSIDNCLTTDPPGNNDQHIHPARLARPSDRRLRQRLPRHPDGPRLTGYTA